MHTTTNAASRIPNKCHARWRRPAVHAQTPTTPQLFPPPPTQPGPPLRCTQPGTTHTRGAKISLHPPKLISMTTSLIQYDVRFSTKNHRHAHTFDTCMHRGPATPPPPPPPPPPPLPSMRCVETLCDHHCACSRTHNHAHPPHAMRSTHHARMPVGPTWYHGPPQHTCSL